MLCDVIYMEKQHYFKGRNYYKALLLYTWYNKEIWQYLCNRRMTYYRRNMGIRLRNLYAVFVNVCVMCNWLSYVYATMCVGKCVYWMLLHVFMNVCVYWWQSYNAKGLSAIE